MKEQNFVGVVGILVLFFGHHGSDCDSEHVMNMTISMNIAVTTTATTLLMTTPTTTIHLMMIPMLINTVVSFLLPYSGCVSTSANSGGAATAEGLRFQ